MSQKPLVLVDGSSYLFRAYHAMPELTNADGLQTGAIFGVINMLKKLMLDYDGSDIVVVFDEKGKTFRHDLYPDYKANRPPMAEELAQQIKPLHEVIVGLGLPLLKEQGVEADDIIGTLARKATEAGVDAVISTGDKDMAQLVNDHITLVNTMTNTTMDEVGVMEKFGVRPDQIIDYLALMGDTVDNVPGVAKVGPKTAVKWLDAYGSLDGVIKNADNIKGKVGENLKAALDFLPLGKQLVTIDCELTGDYRLDNLGRKPIDVPTLIDLFKRLNFKRWLKEVEGNVSGGESESEEGKTSARDYDIVLSQASWTHWKKLLTGTSRFAFDTETTGLNPMLADIVGMSFAIDSGEACYVPLRHDYLGAPEQLDYKTVLADVATLLGNESATIIGQNLKYDYKIMYRAGVTIKAKMIDTMLSAYVLDSTASRLDMDTLAMTYLGEETIHYEEVAGKGAKQIPFNQVAIDKAGPYAAEDADITWQLNDVLNEKLAKDKGLLSIRDNMELPVMKILAQMECHGVLVDGELLVAQSLDLAARISVLQKEIFELAGEPFNIDSPKQLQVILYEKMDLPILKKTPKGQPSTAEPVLSELALQYPLPKAILSYRSLAKLKSTYTDKLPQEINPDTNRVHTSYRQAVTSTGRLASNNPNLQNIPVRTEDGRNIRKAFIAPAGKKIISADYSQIELRIMAHLSKDEGLLKAFSEGVDVHRATAAEVFGVPVSEVSADQRRSAKAINFGLIYGMSAFGLSQQLNIGRAEAQEYIEIYFARYPGVKTYMEKTRESAHENGYVETCFGRRLMMPEINSKNGMRVKAAERAAINAPMQGTAADIIKLAMIDVNAWIKINDFDVVMLMQVHDELVFEVSESQVGEVVAGVKAAMENTAELSVPLLVDVGVGDNWDEAH